jgi:aliphatic nitrilase
MSGLICGENSNPLAVFALTAEGTRIHVMSLAQTIPPAAIPCAIASRSTRRRSRRWSKAFVISACGTVGRAHDRDARADGRRGGEVPAQPRLQRRWRDVAPNSRIIPGRWGRRKASSMPSAISSSASR